LKNSATKQTARTPWHLWVVGVLALVYNAAACYSHVQTLRQDASYFAGTGVTPELAAYFAALPYWYIVMWTIGAWGGLVASVGLLLHKSWSVQWFIASQLGFIVNSVATLLNPKAQEVLGSVGQIWSIATIVIGILVVLYSMAMKRRGVLH
jgi:hypothetical protein